MPLTELHIRNIRNIAETRLNLSPGVTLFSGVNGSGKTSLLEAIYLLGTGKSFRTHRTEKIIRRGEQESTVFGRLSRENGGEDSLGVKKDRTGLEIKKNQKPITNRSILASSLPLMVVTPNSHNLLEGGPQWRRRFVDWGVFHVEQRFSSHWNTFRRLLKQRNALLARQELERAELEAWDSAFVAVVEEITALRRAYLEALEPHAVFFLKALGFEESFDMSYQPGFSLGSSFGEQLAQGYVRDRAMKRTQLGPHRADIRFSFDGVDVRQWISRGQQKLLVYALFLAQNRYLRQTRGKEAILLLDDLSAELDEHRLNKLLVLLEKEFAQVLITTANKESLPKEFVDHARLFHVEQGQVSLLDH